MKKILITFTIIAITACKSEPKDYVTLSGKIDNYASDKELVIQNRAGFLKVIKLNDDGTFSDTLNVKEGKYLMINSNNYGEIFLKNNNESSLVVDAKDFEKSLTFSGDAADVNNFYAAHSLLRNKYLTLDLMSKTENEFDNVFEDFSKDYTDLKESYNTLDTTFLNSADTDFENLHKSYKNYHNNKLALKRSYPTGSPSPVFTNYENHKGGTTSLSDLKGKYVYIDVWATWCGPCKREIPALKKVESKYHNKDIEFVSISIDRETDYNKWKTFVETNNLSGVQLIADNDWNSSFVKNYGIKGIPRFILIDPNGNIVNPDAPRPSDPQLIELFSELNI